MAISHYHVPPGGWKFGQADGTEIRGDTWGELVRNVSAHRVSNLIPLNQVEEEVDAQIEKLHPSIAININRIPQWP